MTRNRALKWTGGILAVPLILIAVFFLAAWIGSSIPRNAGWSEPATGIPVMIESNGVHTGIVMPIVTAEKDWRTTFPSAGMPREQDGYLPTHVAIGWGEKEVFLNTPTWGDLKPGTVARIILSGGEGVMRVAHYLNPQPSPDHRWITLRPAEYRKLVEQIEAALPPLPAGEERYSYDSYERGARYYDANGRYTVTNTCNQWVGDTLAAAGIEMGWWTPLAGGVMKWIPNSRDRQRPADGSGDDGPPPG